jgi:hypothetical protein
MALGLTGITYRVVLNNGDTRIEDCAMDLARAAITDTGLTATVTIQQVTL